MPNITVTQNINNGTGNYNGLQTRVNRRLAKGLQFTVAYTWSHALDNSTGPFSTQGGGGNFFITANGPQIQYNYGNSDDDQRHALNISALTELPFGKGKTFLSNAGPLLNAIVGGFQIDPFVSIGSGTPFSFTYPSNGINNRPDYKGTPYSGNAKIRKVGNALQYFDTTTLTQAPVNTAGNYTRPGTVARNAYYLPGYKTVSVSVIKAIPLPFVERFKGEFRGQVYNLLNTPQFAGLNDTNIGDFNSSSNRYITVNSLRSASERQVELAFRITF